jgi:hypothetical protein
VGLSCFKRFVIIDASELISLQNKDGGWPYDAGAASWTEPTCYALHALSAVGMEGAAAAQNGSRWLTQCERGDGGLSARPSVAESTWVSALTLLLPAPLATNLRRGDTIRWVREQTGRESGWVYRLRLLLMGTPSEASVQFDGWPWYPGEAAWTTPTAMSVLALEHLQSHGREPDLAGRIVQGKEFLLARRCRDGGWNHGSTRARGYDGDSYPETTGQALLALHDVGDAKLAASIAKGEQHLAGCESLQAAYWLVLGLRAHGRPAEVPAGLKRRGSTMETALGILAAEAVEGRHFLTVT